MQNVNPECGIAVENPRPSKGRVRDAFINRLLSQHICQRLLGNTTQDLNTAYRQVKLLESAQRNSDAYSTQGAKSLVMIGSAPTDRSTFTTPAVNAVNKSRKCYFCGRVIPCQV